MRKLSTILLAGAMAILALPSCDNEQETITIDHHEYTYLSDTITVKDNNYQDLVYTLENKTLELGLDETISLGLNVISGQKPKFEIADPEIISIDDNGTVKALKIGETTVKANFEGLQEISVPVKVIGNFVKINGEKRKLEACWLENSVWGKGRAAITTAWEAHTEIRLLDKDLEPGSNDLATSIILELVAFNNVFDPEVNNLIINKEAGDVLDIAIDYETETIKINIKGTYNNYDGLVPIQVTADLPFRDNTKTYSTGSSSIMTRYSGSNWNRSSIYNVILRPGQNNNDTIIINTQNTETWANMMIGNRIVADQKGNLVEFKRSTDFDYTAETFVFIKNPNKKYCLLVADFTTGNETSQSTDNNDYAYGLVMSYTDYADIEQYMDMPYVEINHKTTYYNNVFLNKTLDYAYTIIFAQDDNVEALKNQVRFLVSQENGMDFGQVAVIVVYDEKGEGTYPDMKQVIISGAQIDEEGKTATLGISGKNISASAINAPYKPTNN